MDDEQQRAVPGDVGEEVTGGVPGDAGPAGDAPGRSVPGGARRGSWSRAGWPVVAGCAVVAVGALVLAAVVAWGGGSGDSASAATAPGCGSGAPTLTVRGTGMATGTPNLLTLTLAVDVTGATAQTALSQDNATTSSVIGALTGGGVASRQIQTTGLSIQPSYDTKGVLTGYSVRNSVVAKLHDFATAGAVIDAAAGAAGNAVRIDSLTFSIRDPRGVEDQARQDAVHQAVSHAATMAAAAGERLGRVCSLDDKSSMSLPQNGGFVAEGSPVSAPAVPLQPGTQQASAQVRLVYALVRGGGAGATGGHAG